MHAKIVPGKGCSPLHQIEGLGSAVSSLSGVRGEAQATWGFTTFHRRTKTFLVSILLTLNLFQWNFRGGPSHRKPHIPTTTFLWGPDPRTVVGSAPMNGQTDKQTVVKTVHAATSVGGKDGFHNIGMCRNPA